MKKTRFIFFIVFAFCQANAQYIPFTKEESRLIQEKKAIEVFRVLLTTDKNDSVLLRKESIPLDPKNELTAVLASRMFATVQDENTKGVGIAAPQIGINRKAFWIQRFDKNEHPFEFFINPEIKWFSQLKRKGREGCLSIPDIIGQVVRSYTIRIEYDDLQGKHHDEIIEGFTAVIAQHEFDHLTGKLFTDRLEEQNSKEYYETYLHDQMLLLEK